MLSSSVKRILYLNSGSCNGCDIELLVALTELEQLGYMFSVDQEVKSQKYDILVFTGPVTAQSLCRLVRMIRRAGGKVRIDHAVIIGSCACDGGIWYDTYATLGGFDRLLDYLSQEGLVLEVGDKIYVTGCPARPDAIQRALEELVGKS